MAVCNGSSSQTGHKQVSYLSMNDSTLFASLNEKYRLELLQTLVKRNLKIRYKGSVFGFLWSLFTPLSQILIYVVFAKILKFNNGNPHYLQFLVGGIILWQFTAGCLNDSLFAIVGNANLVKKVFFPRLLLPLSTALATGINFLIAFAVLIIYLLITGIAVFHGGYLAAAVAMHLLLGIGLCCLCSTLNVFFRDTQHWIGILSQIWFFLSPVFYGLDMQIDVMEKHFSFASPSLVYLNPMTGILSAYRQALMAPSTPRVLESGRVISGWVPLGAAPLAISAVVCVAVFVIGILVLRAGNKKLGDVL